MLYSKLFGKTLNIPIKKYDSINHQLLIKAGYIDQVASGIYTLLPLGKKVIDNINDIIRQELNKIGALEILMPSLHPKNYWEITDRWESVDVLFKTKSQYGQFYALGPTHEEIITPLVKKFVNSYKDLPLALYHISTKFRDEPRPKSGILRGREFIMKDLYSFHLTEEDLKDYYQQVLQTYLKIFQKIGFSEIKITEASGGTFTKKFSHEFNVLTPSGEVNLFYCSRCSFAQNQEISKLKNEVICPKCKKGKIRFGKAIEIGNIFDLGTRFSQPFDLYVEDKNRKKVFLYMGCYGIGVTRILGALVEVFHDDKGIVWPKSVAPFKTHLVGLNLDDESTYSLAQKIYQLLTNSSISTLFDDRIAISPGRKLIDADLIGIPIQIIISKKNKDKIELKTRADSRSILIDEYELVDKINEFYEKE